MKKKVLFIATVLRDHLLVFHLPYMQWFQQQGYEVHCCAKNDTGENPPSVPYCDRYIEIAFERSPFHPGNVKAYRQLKVLLNREEYALIHCHTPVGGMLGRLAARETRRRGTRVCYTAHGFHFFSGAPFGNWLLFYVAERFLARLTDLLITINHEDFERAKRFKAKEVALVHGVGVDLSRFDFKADRLSIRNEIGIDANMAMVITVGAHVKSKNHAMCISVLEKTNGAELVFCGEGRQEETLKKLARERGIENRVHFLGYRKDIPALLIASDIFLFPSLREGLPVSLMEAMAAGLPCVVSGVRGNMDLIGDGNGGYLYKPNNMDGFASGLRTLIDNRKLCKQFGERNKAEIRRYDLQSIRKQMAALYLAQLKRGGDA